TVAPPKNHTMRALILAAMAILGVGAGLLSKRHATVAHEPAGEPARPPVALSVREPVPAPSTPPLAPGPAPPVAAAVSPAARLGLATQGRSSTHRSIAPTKRVGYLTIGADPWGVVYVDGRLAAPQTPVYKLPTPVGPHRIEVFSPNRDRHSKVKR